MSFWVISTFNFSAFYEQGVNQDSKLTASCKGLINWRFMGQWQRKAVEWRLKRDLVPKGPGWLQDLPSTSAEGPCWDPGTSGLGVMVG